MRKHNIKKTWNKWYGKIYFERDVTGFLNDPDNINILKLFSTSGFTAVLKSCVAPKRIMEQISCFNFRDHRQIELGILSEFN